MPTSQPEQLSKIVTLIVHLNPRSVLDIGPGFGKYGMLCREYLELWTVRQEYGQFSSRIDAIEVFPEYITPVHRHVYDHIYVGNARDLVGTLVEQYDLALLIDVLEHFKKEDGQRLMADLLRRSKNLLISVPKDIGNQGEAFHNPHEAHVASWSRQELLSVAAGFFIPDRMSHIVFLGDRVAVERLRWTFAPPALVRIKRALQEALS